MKKLIFIFFIIAFAFTSNADYCKLCRRTRVLGNNDYCTRCFNSDVAKKSRQEYQEKIKNAKALDKKSNPSRKCLPEFKLASIKFPNVKYNNYFTFDTEKRSWTSRRNGRVIEGIWRTCTEDRKFIYIENDDEKFISIYIPALIDKDKKYIESRIELYEKKNYIWWEGGFFSLTSKKFIQQAEKLVVERSIPVSVQYRIFRVLKYGAIAHLNSGKYGKKFYNGQDFFLSENIDGIAANDCQMNGKLFWASTYKWNLTRYETHVINQYTSTFSSAVFLLRAKMNMYDETDHEYDRFQSYNEIKTIGKTVTPPSPPKNRPSTYGLNSTGSGFFITKDGYLITNYHVISGGTEIKVLTNNGVLVAEIVKSDPETDLALLKVDAQVSPCKFSNRKLEKLGSEIFTMGFPMPGLQGFSPKVTKGVISGIDGFMGDVREYQIDATIQPGNSGGPLFDTYGRLVGVLVATLKKGQAVNYAIKKSYLMAFLDSVQECVDKLEKSNNINKIPLETAVENTKDSCVLILNYQY